MTDASGVVAYNIFRNNFIGVLAKGFSGARIYNNTFYNSMSAANSSATIFIQENDGSGGGNAPSTGTKIYNNIFYQTQSIPMIYIRDASCISGFASDYNVFYCANGNPWFVYGGVIKTFAQWQALGYDIHSVVVNPNFNNFTDFVPAARLDFGTDLGSAIQAGVSTNAIWTVNSAPATATQNGLWQAGARIYNTGTITISYVNSAIGNATPSILEMTFIESLANIVPPTTAFQVLVNSVARNVNAVSVSGTRVLLTLASPVIYGDVVTVAYTKPAASPLQSVSGAQAVSLSSQKVTNNTVSAVKQIPLTIKMTVYPNPVHHTVNIQWVYASSITGQDATVLVGKISILDLSGKLCTEKLIQSGVTSQRIPIDLKSGIYIVVASSSSGIVMASQKIIVY
jgi:uncharacterized repeat protein (TIGR02059 family)